MKTQKLKNLKIIPPRKTSGEYETAPYLPKMHQVCIAVGKRASGKSTAIVNLIEQMKFDWRFTGSWWGCAVNMFNISEVIGS